MLKYLEDLCLLPGIAGQEEAVAGYIIDVAVNQCHATSVRQDILGNVIIEKKAKKPNPKAPKLMIAAHIDEVGFMINFVEDSGYLRFAAVGGIDKRVVLGHKVYIGENMVEGVIGLKAFHLVDKAHGEDKTPPEFRDMYIDIGARSKEEALKRIKLGDQVIFHSDFTEFGHNQIKAKAIDDRYGCAAMLNLMKEDLPMDVTFAFTVQEEIGTRGAFVVGYRENPDIAIVFEGASCSDIPTVDDLNKISRIGNGPVIGYIDNGAIYDQDLFKLISGIATEHKIPWQIKTKIAGGTDASAFQKSKTGIRVANISVPVRNIHSASTIANLDDIDNAYKLCKLFVTAVAEGKAK